MKWTTKIYYVTFWQLNYHFKIIFDVSSLYTYIG